MDSKISLCMIAKNEAGNIGRCLASVKEIVDEIVVIDTGSSDNTVEIARKFGAVIHTFSWNENFSDARNASLELATGDWILFLDADEELAAESRQRLRELVADQAVEGYFVKIVNYVGNEGWIETCPDVVFRLFRNRLDYRFRGAIHEQIVDVILENNNQACYRMADDVVIIHYGYLDRQISEKDKKTRNLNIIRKELAQDPQNRLLRYHYGVELFRAEKYAEAANELIQAANGIDPGTIYLPKLLRYIVISYQSTAQPLKALDIVQQGLRLYPNYADLYYYAGLLYLDLKRYAQASKSFRKAISMPEQPAQYASFGGVRGFRSYYHLGQIAELFLDHEEALRNYIACLNDNPNFTSALESVVCILKPRENPAYAKECIEKVFEFCTPSANLIIGEMFFRHGAYALALEYLEKGTPNAPLHPEIQLWKAICLLQEQRNLEALRILDGFDPDSHLFALAKLNQALFLWVQGKKRKQKTVLAELRALGLAEDTEKVLSLLSGSHERRKSARQVTLGLDGIALLIDILKRLLSLPEIDRAMYLVNSVPESLTEHRMEIAQLLYDYGYLDKAEVILRNHLAANQDGKAHFILAEICQESGNYIEAEQHYRFALALEPDEPRHYIRLINLYENRRREILREAKQKYPDVEIFSRLG